MRRFRFFVLVFGMLQFAQSTQGQPVPPSFLAHVDLFASTVEDIIRTDMARIIPVLTNAQRDLVKTITIRVDRSDMNPSGSRAFVGPDGRRYIVLTIGFLISADLMDHAFLEMISLNGELEPYMRYVRDTFRENVEAGALGKRGPELKMYCEYLGNSPSMCRSLRSTADYSAQFSTIKISAVAVVIGHELGHHLLGHFDKNKGIRPTQKELEADKFAASLATRAGFNPMLSMGTFMFFGADQIDITAPPTNDPHPRPLCRAVAAYEVGIEEILNNPQYLEALPQGNEQKLRASNRQLKALKENENCS